LKSGERVLALRSHRRVRIARAGPFQGFTRRLIAAEASRELAERPGDVHAHERVGMRTKSLT
jgi:hypothetical protein